MNRYSQLKTQRGNVEMFWKHVDFQRHADYMGIGS